MNPNALFAVFPFLFIGFWLFITAMLGRMSGWFALQERYPDRDEIPLLRLRGESGQLGRGDPFNPWGGVSFGGCLRLDVCPGGLRVAVWWVFGPFERPFLVPWGEIQVEESKLWIIKRFRLEFRGTYGNALTIRPGTYARIAAMHPLKVG